MDAVRRKNGTKGQAQLGLFESAEENRPLGATWRLPADVAGILADVNRDAA